MEHGSLRAGGGVSLRFHKLGQNPQFKWSIAFLTIEVDALSAYREWDPHHEISID